MCRAPAFLLARSVITLIIMLAAAPAAFGTPLECADTCWVGHSSGTVGTTVSVPITFKNCTELGGIVIPLKWDPDIVTLNSIDFTSSRVGYIGQKSTGTDIDNDANTVQLFALPTSEDMIAVGEGLFATLWFHIDAVSEEPVVIDTTFIPPAGSYIFSEPDATPVPTKFMPGSITVTMSCDCGLWGDINGDADLTPTDVVFMINKVYLGNDMFVIPPNCPLYPGDVNCDGEITPVDAVFYIGKIYLGNDRFCPNPCTP